jgi:hypothetical protein
MADVTYSDPRQSVRLGGPTRVLLAALGVGLFVLLAVAGVLDPSPSGFGTHRQLGLPPCTFTALFGMRCPSCGMTTSWAHLVRGNVIAAVQSNLGGTLLGISALLAAPWLFVSAVRGRWWVFAPEQRVGITVGVVIGAVTLLDWLWRYWSG